MLYTTHVPTSKGVTMFPCTPLPVSADTREDVSTSTSTSAHNSMLPCIHRGWVCITSDAEIIAFSYAHEHVFTLRITRSRWFGLAWRATTYTVASHADLPHARGRLCDALFGGHRAEALCSEACGYVTPQP